jgi:hypothetical protein
MFDMVLQYRKGILDMEQRWPLFVSVSTIALLAACAAAGVVATSDSAKELSDAMELFDYAGRPLPAEKLIVEAIAKYRASDNELGLAEGYRVYGLFFRSKSLSEPGYKKAYSERGFLDPSATWENRYAASLEYFRKSAAILTRFDRLDLLSNVYFHMGEDSILMHDMANACAELDQSLEAHAEFMRRHPGTDVDLPRGYKSFDDAIAPAKQAAGCAVPTA